MAVVSVSVALALIIKILDMLMIRMGLTFW
ncbi:MAG: hypothetical protein ACLTSZ_00345 [Lachnospiraceae bacterium]